MEHDIKIQTQSVWRSGQIALSAGLKSADQTRR